MRKRRRKSIVESKYSTKIRIPTDTKELIRFDLVSMNGIFVIPCFIKDEDCLSKPKEVATLKKIVEEYDFMVDIETIERVPTCDLNLHNFVGCYAIGCPHYCIAKNLTQLANKIKPELKNIYDNQDEMIRTITQSQKLYHSQEFAVAEDEDYECLGGGFNQIVEIQPLEFDDRSYQ